MSPRAVGGRRLSYVELPDAVCDWVESCVGQVSVLTQHVGGMSPGCACSLQASNGGRYFLKAVGEHLNARTVEIFRAEAAVLPLLSSVRYRPNLMGLYDHDGWVALLLEHVDGRFPDLDEDGDFDALASAMAEQAKELTPAPIGVPGNALMSNNARRWLERWQVIKAYPDSYLPTWAAARVDELFGRVEGLPQQLPPESLCHCDGRDDNALIRPDGTAVILDWGMWQLGPSWLDGALLAVQRSDARAANRWLQSWLLPEHGEAVTNLFVAFGGSQAWRAAQPGDPTLPAMQAYCLDDAERFLTLARIRLEGA